MADIDLIPADYRERISSQRSIKLSLAIAGTTLLIAGTVILGLITMQKKALHTTASLTTQYAVAEQKQTQLISLDEQLSDLQEQVETLRGLRGGGRVTELFSALDNALDKTDIRLLDWDLYRNAKTATSRDKVEAHTFSWELPSRYRDTQTEFWHVDIQIVIRGHARNYASVADFVNNMLAQPEFETVEIIRTSLTEIDGRNYVEFSINAKVNSNEMS